MNPSYKRTFIFGDIHFPFHHPVALAVAMYYCIKWKPEVIVQVGDLRDWYSSSRFTRKVNLFTPKEEDEKATYLSDLFWETLIKHLPKAEKWQLMGNHDIRPIKRVEENCSELTDDIIERVQERYTFDGVKTVYDPTEELDLYGVRFIHGYRNLGDHVAFNQMPIVCGHTHRGGFLTLPMHDKIAWELNAGYLANPEHPALRYTMQKKATRWTHGFATIDEDGPRFHYLEREFLEKVAKSKDLKDFIF